MNAADSKKAKTRNIIIFAAIGAVALGAIGFLIYQNQQLKKQGTEYEYKMDDLNLEILDLEDDLKDFESELDSKDLEVEEKDRLLAEKELEILEKQKKIDLLVKTNRITKAEAEELRGKIEQLEYYVRKYQTEIDELKTVVTDLTVKNTELKSNLDSLQDEKFDLEQKNLLNETILEAAAILTTDHYHFYRVKRSGKLDEDVEFRDGRLKTLRICFEITPNTVAKSGEREVFITISGPEGKEVKDSGTQSGTFKHESKDKVYTMKTSVMYDRQTTKVCADYEKPEDQSFSSGRHIVKVYCEGYVIGESTFNIK